jgi:hypothetical protein
VVGVERVMFATDYPLPTRPRRRRRELPCDRGTRSGRTRADRRRQLGRARGRHPSLICGGNRPACRKRHGRRRRPSVPAGIGCGVTRR